MSIIKADDRLIATAIGAAIEKAVQEEVEAALPGIQSKVRQRIGGIVTELAKMYSVDYSGHEVRITLKDMR